MRGGARKGAGRKVGSVKTDNRKKIYNSIRYKTRAYNSIRNYKKNT